MQEVRLIFSADYFIHDMRITIKRIDQNFPLPEYKTDGAAAFDLYSRESVAIPAKSLARLPSNLIIETPSGYVLQLSARSSLAQKKGLMLANGVGVIDGDFCGPTDEILISVYNFTDYETVVEAGERIAQGMFLKVERGVFEESAEMQNNSRGGFGSTGI